MAHNLLGLGTASLDSYLGLITLAPAPDLPEGASPRNWDVDYFVGSVITRAGLSSVYTFTQTLNITALSVSYGVGTFTYTSVKQPVVNESFLLSGFTGALSFLNSTQITVIFVDPSSSTFLADVSSDDISLTTGLSASAASTTGNFTGPNVGGNAAVIASSGNPWSNPTAILGDIAYASTVTGAATSSTVTPGAAANTSTEAPWTSPGNILLTGASVATVSLTGNSVSAAILANGINYNLPIDAVVTGIVVKTNASSTGAAGTASLNIQLATNGFPMGTAVNVPIGSTTNLYTVGSSTYQWGAQLSPAVVNGSSFGILIEAQLSSGSGTFHANTLTIEVYYTTASGSEALQVTKFLFAIPSTAGVSGFGVTFQAYSSAATEVTLQLLKNGIPVGTPRTQVLTKTPEIYSLGASNDLWDSTWLFSDVNNPNFGVQVVGTQLGTTFINDLDVLVYLTPTLSNFNYVKSYVQDNGQTSTLALDSSGILWKEDVDNAPNVLAIALTGILPGSFAKSATADDQEYICFSDLSVGTDRPRVYNGSQFLPLSQVGPGAPPSILSSVGTTSVNTLTITNYSVAGHVVTFTYTTGPTVTAGQIYSITGATPDYLNITGTVLSSGLSSTEFQMDINHDDDAGGSVTATANLAFGYTIASITQRGANPKAGTWQDILWSAGPGNGSTNGSILTVYYSFGASAVDASLVNAFNSGNPVYVYLNNLPIMFPFKGTYQVTSTGLGTPPGGGAERWYFTVNVGTVSTSVQQAHGSVGSASYEQTVATVTTTAPIPVSQGQSVTIIGAVSSPGGWDATWPVTQTLTSGVLNITQTSMSSGGTATYAYNVSSGSNPASGQTVNVTGCTNGDGIFNGIFVIGTVSGTSSGTFTVSGFSSGAVAATSESGQAQTYGTQFLIDPGASALGTTNSPIFGNDTRGTITIAGSNTGSTIGAGTRQAVCFFITESGYETAPSNPIVFTVGQNTNTIVATQIPVGPPNVTARAIAFTEAGQNGVPGANFYVIENDVVVQAGNSTVTYTSTIIRDNVTTSATFSFTDAVLLNSTEIDIQGNDLFNLIELGSSAWCVPYAARMFYGLQLNKIDNLVNLSFDGGYIPNPGGNTLPLGWGVSSTLQSSITLQDSIVNGMSLYVVNNTGGVIGQDWLLSQTASVDYYKVPIVLPNTAYSVRVAARNPSGINVGSFSVSLVGFDQINGFGTVWGTFTVPLSSMTSNFAVFSGTLLTVPFVTTVPTNLQLALQVTNFGPGSDVELDRIEVYPTAEPYLNAQVYGSYVNNMEAIDAGGTGGIIDTTSENPQPCMGGFVMRDNLYLLKTTSWYVTEDNTTSEPGGWELREVSNRVGTVGISAYDVGEEWCVTACRPGIFGFNGGAPVKLMHEIWNVWEAINWNAGNTIVLRNDIVNRRILCAVPLPTPNAWLPYDPPNPSPTSPNVILMCNYQGLNTFEELMSGAGIHTTMFGTLAAVDMRRKWSIWRITTPYMDFVTRPDGIDHPLFICNGTQSSKIYQLLDDQLSDDGVAINGLYTTYGFVNAAKAVTMPIFGMHAKRYLTLQFTAEGAGTLNVRVLTNTLSARYPYTIPNGIALSTPVNDDYFRPLNIKANRCFLEFSTNEVGAYFELHKILLSGKADPWSTLNPTGGGNAGIV
jgi:hypothetical protein